MSKTIEETIEQLETLKKNAKYAEALDIAILAIKTLNDPINCYTCVHIDEPIDSDACDSCYNYSNFERDADV